MIFRVPIQELILTRCKIPQMISVVIPTYNRADTIERSIQSVLNQTYSDFENTGIKPSKMTPLVTFRKLAFHYELKLPFFAKISHQLS